MIFESKEEKKKRKRAKRRRSWGKKIHKLIFLAGIAVAYRGLKGWLWGKKKR